MTSPNPVVCGTCGATVAGRFCGQCGTPAGTTRCHNCGTGIRSDAKFCHHCGAESKPGIPPRKERLAWAVASVAVLAVVAISAYLMGKGNLPQAPAPQMSNAGNAGAVRAPDITKLSPRQQFDRLYERTMRAPPDSVGLFATMTLGAYDQLDQIDIDARYHAAMIQVLLGEFPAALALADSIARENPKHLFGFLIRGEIALEQKDSAALATSYRGFLAAYDAEIKANRKEYLEHPPALDDFRRRATAARN